MIRDWEVSQQPFLTDHLLVTYLIEHIDASGNLPGDQPLSEEFPNQSFRNMDWRLLNTVLLADLTATVNFDEKELDAKIRILTKVLSRAEVDAAPARRTSKISPKWLNKQLDQLGASKVSNERKRRKAKQRHGIDHKICLQARAAFRDDRTKYVNGVRHFKKNSWLECVRIPRRRTPGALPIRSYWGRSNCAPRWWR